jgi:hypothetical protein
MTDYKIGGNATGGKYPKVHALPKGLRVRVAEVTAQLSRAFPTKKKKDGTEVPNYQLCVVLEALEPGVTLAHGKDAAKPFEPGQRFVQYLGGVWLNDDGSYGIGEGNSGAYQFLHALQAQGVEMTGGFADLAGIEFVADRVKTSGPGGTGVRIEPAEGTAKRSGSGPALASRPGSPPSPAAPASTSAYAALPEKDRADIEAALAAGDVLPTDLVEAGIASDLTHAEAILATRPASNPLLRRK